MLLSAQHQRGGGLPKQLPVGTTYVVEVRSRIRDQVLATVPTLRAFAMSLCGNIDRADDLGQETLLRALTHIDSFERGTKMAAWLVTILRNLFHDDYRKRQREVEDADGRYSETLVSHPEQTGRVEFGELRAAPAKLPSDQREALILVGAAGFSYEQPGSRAHRPVTAHPVRSQ